MRLLTVGNMYPPQHLGGYEVVWSGAVEHLRECGHEVSVLTTDTRLHHEVAGDPAFVRRDLRWNWREHAFHPESARVTLLRERHNAAVLRRALREKPDAVLWWSMGGLSLSVIGQVAAAGVPSGAVVHDAWPIYGPRVDPWMAVGRRAAVGGRMLRMRSGFDVSAVAGWSFNSDLVRRAVVEALPEIEPARCRVDLPGIDSARFAAPAAGEWRWRLACVGRVDPRKGLAVAIGALAQLPSLATLTIAGGGDPGHLVELEDLAGTLGVRDRVSFTGPIDDVAAVYAAADALLFPVTWEEPFGLVPLEAMAAGRPVIATGTGGSGEYLTDAENALLVPPGDADALAGAVTRLAGDHALRQRLTANGLITAAANPSSRFDEAIEEFAGAISAGGRAGRAGR